MPSIADPHSDVLALLDEPKRLGLINWMSTRYYDGWRPSRAEIADLVAVELGVLQVGEAIDRNRDRLLGQPVPDIRPWIQACLDARNRRRLPAGVIRPSHHVLESARRNVHQGSDGTP